MYMYNDMPLIYISEYLTTRAEQGKMEYNIHSCNQVLANTIQVPVWLRVCGQKPGQVYLPK